MPTDPNSTAQNFGASSMRRLSGNDGGDDDSTSSTPNDGQPSSQGDPQAALANMTNTIRECEERIMSVAGNNPKVAKEVREARTALRRLMAALVSNPNSTAEQPAPRTGY